MERFRKWARTPLGGITYYALFFLVFLGLVTDFVEALYVFGLLGTDIPPEIALVVVFLSPVIWLFFRRGISSQWLPILISLALLARAIEPWVGTRWRMIIAGLGVAIWLLAFTLDLWLAHRQPSTAGRQMGAGLALAVALSLLFRAAYSGIDITSAGPFRLLGIALLLVALDLNWFRYQNDQYQQGLVGPSGQLGRLLLRLVGIVAVIVLLYFGFLGANLFSRWVGGALDLLTVLLTMFAALTLYAWVWYRLPSLFDGSRRVILWGLTAVFVAALGALLYSAQVSFPQVATGYPFLAPELPAWSWLAQLLTLLTFPILFVDLAVLIGAVRDQKPSLPAVGGGMAVAGLFFLIMVLAHVFTTTYDYIPVIGPTFRDRFWLVYLVPGLLIVLALLTVRRGSIVQSEAGLPRALAATILVIGLLALALTWLRSTELTQSQRTEAFPVRVLSYNMQQGYSEDGRKNSDGQLDLFRRVNPDLIGLSESDTNRIAQGNIDLVAYYADELGMNAYYGPSPVAGTFGIALLSHYELIDPQTYFLWSPEEQTAVIRAQIDVAGERISVLVTHLDNGGRLEQQEEILSLVGEEPTILLGDFNFRPIERQSGQISAQYAATTALLEDAWEQRWPDRDAEHGERIDHLFISPGLTAVDVQYIEAPASETDHPALWVDVGQE